VTGEPSPERAAAVNADGETRPRRAASEIADLVATRVRDAIEQAERSAQVLKTQAHDDASARRGAVRDRATEVLARIDELERKLTRILQDMRAEAAQIAKTVDAPGAAADDREPRRGTFVQVDERTWRSEATAGGPEQSGAVAEQEPATPAADDRPAAEPPAERFEWRGPAGVERVETKAPDEAGGQDDRTGDPPAAAAESPLDEAGDAPDQHAEPAPDDVALAATQEGEPVTWGATEPHEQDESGAEHPHDAARRRRPGLFRHRRDD
jgi:hypothetical protein